MNIRNLFIACVLLASCAPTAKNQNDSKRNATVKEIGYPYPSVYRNVGTVTVDSSRRKAN